MANRTIERLSARQAATITKPGRHADGGNLYLSVSSEGWRRWTFLYRERGTGRLREMGLGPAIGPKRAGLSLADARRKAAQARQLLYNGTDPLYDKQAAKEAAELARRQAKTFGEFADEFIESIATGFKSAVHLAQWKSTLARYAGPLRPLALKDIKTDDVLNVIRPIWDAKQETASRVRQRIERILDAAKAKGLRSGDNPAAWRGNLKELMANAKVAKRVHHAAVPYDDMPAFMEDLRKRNSISALALEFTILCAARTAETIGADWAEFDLVKKIWTVPGDRMKAGRNHHVPLPDRAVAILESLIVPGVTPTGYVFAGQKRGGALSNMAMLECLRDLRGKGTTVHGFRSTFRDWVGDKTTFPRDIAEAALAHALKDKTEAAYRRATALEHRRSLMKAWSDFLAERPTRSAGAGGSHA
jgi:integrase